MKPASFKSLATLAALTLFVGACAAPAAKPAAEAPKAPEATATTAAAVEAPADEYKIGMIMVGPYNDKGWSQAHFDAMEYVVGKMPNVKYDYVDKVNPADRPNTKGSQVADDLIAKGAKMIIFNSDDFKDEALETAKKHPDIRVIHASGDYAWKDGNNFKDQKNLGNTMGEMEYGKMIGGCAAALTTQTGQIGYLGPLINEETRRLVNSAYLGARYCYEKYAGKNPDDLKFKVTWIGFWFNIPGVTLDPTKVADDFYNGGYDVVMSGIDTPEGAVQGKKAADAGKKVFYVHYDYKQGCELAPEICLGVPVLQLGPLLPGHRQARDRRQVHGRVDLVRPRLEGHQQRRHLWRGLRHGQRPGRQQSQGRGVHQGPGRRQHRPVHRPPHFPGRLGLPEGRREGDPAANLVHPAVAQGRRRPQQRAISSWSVERGAIVRSLHAPRSTLYAPRSALTA